MVQTDLSIVVPVYRVEKYLRRCMDSILQQKDVNLEVIAVDDGSPDGCPGILDGYAAADSRVKVIHQPNGGVSNARNTGIGHATGRWIYFADSDDWLAGSPLKEMVRQADAENLDILFVDCNEQYENGQSARLRLFSQSFVTEDRECIMAVQRSVLCHKMSPYFSPGADSAYPAPWSKLVRTALVKENGIRFDPYVGGVYDDGLFTLEILEKAKKIAYSGICAYNYRILTSSIVHSYKPGMVVKFEKNCERVDAFMQRYNKGEAFRDAEYARRVAYLSSFMPVFFMPAEQGAAKEKKEEYRAVVSRSPWKEAIANARMDLLETKHKATLICMRTGLTAGLKLYSRLKLQKAGSRNA